MTDIPSGRETWNWTIGLSTGGLVFSMSMIIILYLWGQDTAIHKHANEMAWVSFLGILAGRGIMPSVEAWVKK